MTMWSDYIKEYLEPLQKKIISSDIDGEGIKLFAAAVGCATFYAKKERHEHKEEGGHNENHR